MTTDDFRTLLNEALKPLKEGQEELRKDLQEVKDTQENRVLPSVITTETTIKGYADAYKTNKANIERLEDRVIQLEDKAGVIPPPEFIIQR